MKKYIVKFIFIYLSIFFIGCSGLISKQEYPKKNFFILEADKSKLTREKNKFGNLKIIKFKISPFYETKFFVYKLTENTFDSDYYNEFMIFPSYNITEIYSKWIYDSGFGNNHPFSNTDDTQYQLTGNILSLYGDFIDKKKPKAVLEIEIFLQKSGTQNLLLNKTYKKEENMKDATPNDLIKSWNNLLTDLLVQLNEDLKKVEVK
jgi:hypothetical protein